MKDTGICPFCDQEFAVTPDMYGCKKQCPLCGKQIDIFADPEYYIDTLFGALPIGSIKKETLGGRFLSALVLRLQKRKIHLADLKEGLRNERHSDLSI